MRALTSTTSGFIIIEGPPRVNRQGAKEALNLFMKTLSFDFSDLEDLFSCKRSEKTMEDGSRILDGIAMDGTAASILGDLSIFERYTSILQHPGRSLSDNQYLIFTSYCRNFFGPLF